MGTRNDVDVSENRHYFIPARSLTPGCQASILATVSTTLSPGLGCEILKPNDRTECWPDDQNQQTALNHQLVSFIAILYDLTWNSLIGAVLFKL